MLATWRDKLLMKELTFSLLIGIITCFLDSPFVVILMHSLGLFELLMILLIWSIFWALRDGNVFLIFKTSNVLIEVFEAWAYDFPGLVLFPWALLLTIDFLGWKYLEMTLTSFLVLAGKGGGGGALLIVTGTGFKISFLLSFLGGIDLGVNLEEIFALSVLDFWSVCRAFYLAS